MDSGNQFDSKAIGKRIKKRAKDLGYTGESLAEEMNIGYDTLSRIYRGKSIRTEYIYELSEILNVSTDYLLKGKEDNLPDMDNPDREKYMMFLSGLSDQELAITVMHAEVTLKMRGMQDCL